MRRCKILQFISIVIIAAILVALLHKFKAAENGGRASSVLVLSDLNVFTKSNIHKMLGTSELTTTIESTQVNESCPEYSGMPYDRQLMDVELPRVLKEQIRNGSWSPHNCRPKQKVAVLIPFRNRFSHLRSLLKSLHKLLPAQNQDYRIFVIHQAKDTVFNRGMLFNIGVNESLKLFPADCFIIHDVDMRPERLNIRYDCTVSPRHLSHRQDRFVVHGKPYSTGEEMWRMQHYGGVMAVSKEQYYSSNGFSNLYFGWGREDDDFALRIKQKGYVIEKDQNGYYKTFRHGRDKYNHDNGKGIVLVHFAKERQFCEGLNSLQKFSCYKLLRIAFNTPYTEILVDIPNGAKC